MRTPARSTKPSASGSAARVCSRTGSARRSVATPNGASGPRTVAIGPAPERGDDPPAIGRLDQVQEVHVLIGEYVDAGDPATELGDPDVEQLAGPSPADPGGRPFDHLVGGGLVEHGRAVTALAERALRERGMEGPG